MIINGQRLIINNNLIINKMQSRLAMRAPLLFFENFGKRLRENSGRYHYWNFYAAFFIVLAIGRGSEKLICGRGADDQIESQRRK